MRKLKCLRCGRSMSRIKREHLFMGQIGWQWGDAHYQPSSGLDVDVYCCPDCGKLEFYRGEKDRDKRVAGQSIAQVKCSRCGGRYDLDSCKCPFCGEENDKLF
ncbi:Uncharacterised protein [uncultured Clostridium sp.]|uniref:hypothetical protein n=1 Tax=Muriventricola aceti TaxID=2981773 RepID=UPI000821B54B|nr:hypothetical protein [Muriventricola aceti]MBS5590554.1 hypothetical protein [Clostridiales bacterium]MCU6701711.1 hypothetical protein [Muriventricola aceti]SCG95685.1 Uncharacterised protein [uncultured Clostridium sp.]SCI73207.1 Uncharacterised protein [uncultured Flavonifractor sp.]